MSRRQRTNTRCCTIVKLHQSLESHVQAELSQCIDPQFEVVDDMHFAIDNNCQPREKGSNGKGLVSKRPMLMLNGLFRTANVFFALHSPNLITSFHIHSH